MKLLILLLLATPALAQGPGWAFKPICDDGTLVGLIIMAPEPGVVSVRFDPRLCAGHI